MSNQDQDKKKKRRWDVPGGGPAASNTSAPPQNIQPNGAPNVESGSTLNAAQLAAAKLQQILAQKGISTVVQDAGATAELEINDYSPEIRSLLTRGATHEQIRAETGATILSRGYYLAPGTQSLVDRPLYLLISGENTIVVERAKEKLQELINKAQTQLTVKVYIGLENTRPEFGLIPRLLGAKGSFVKYINNETSAKIQLHGRGSGYLEPNTKLEAPDALHFVISATTQLALDKARSMAKDLIDHVQRDYAKAYQQPAHVPMHYAAMPYMPYPPPGTGVMIPPPTHMYSHMPPPPSMFVPASTVPAAANVPLYPELQKKESEVESHAKDSEAKEDQSVSVGPRRPTAADIEQSRSRLVELPEHAYESHSASEDERSDAERMPPPPRVVPGTVSPAKRKRRNSLTHATDDKFPAPKRQKVSGADHSDEESSEEEAAGGFKLVNYDETADDDKFTAPRNKTPFWAAPPPGKPMFSVLGGHDEDQKDDDEDEDDTPVLGSSNLKGKDYDKLHNEVLKGLGLK
eukprot:TRINITY_DN5307_c0_g1_i1.p1 TRINITY_DN5307_c0_g1~~TRINITY_DN5307_c0_g1_i1.p1  ORF type:complete len:520 (-),score=115.89 TRINITY_DN5307_c0_g1_i1:30-1589(-)